MKGGVAFAGATINRNGETPCNKGPAVREPEGRVAGGRESGEAWVALEPRRNKVKARPQKLAAKRPT